MARLPATGVIFDLDGTLIDSAPDIHATAQKVLAAEGLAAMEFATVKGFIGAGVGTLVQRILVAQGQDAHGRAASQNGRGICEDIRRSR